MNKINFAQKNHAHRTTKKFFLFKKLPLMFCIAALALMATLQIMQWFTLHNVRQEKQLIEKRLAPFNQLNGETKKLENELPALEKTVKKMEQAKQAQDPFMQLFHSIHTILGTTGSVESLSITKKQLELTISCANVKTAQEFMDKLAQNPAISSIDLSSIRKGATQLLFAITGTLV